MVSMSGVSRYDSLSAWRRAAGYFIVCFVVAGIMGVPQTLVHQPLATDVQLGDVRWRIATAGVTAYVLFAYAWYWPRGTTHCGRRGHPVATPLFGLLWGAAQGQLIVALFFAIEQLGFSGIITTVIVFTLYSAWAGLWQSQYWDIYIAPEHNLRGWNLRKVLVAHVPYLALSLLHLMTFRNVALFVIWQIVALTASAWAMRFPAPWQREAKQ